MIARLRKKFILIAVGSVTLVLVVLMGIVNAASFVKLDQNAGAVLQVLLENQGCFPDNFQHQDTARVPDGTTPPAGQTGLRPAIRRGFSPETPYETRYFTVTFQADGALASVNTGRIAAVSTEEAVSLAQTLLDRQKRSGYSGSYKYLSADTDSGTLYVFLDCTRDLNAFQDFLTTSLLVSLCGILAVAVLVAALSRRAVRPVAESYEKQKEFITNAGHELKTPLAIMDSCVEVLELEQGESKWTTGIRGQIRRLAALTQSLVSLARMDESSDTMPKEPFSLSEAVEETLAPFALLAENRGLHLESRIQPDVQLCGNEQALRQLCSILADNAVKYAAPGGTLCFTLTKKGRRAVLTSENPAEGLTPGDQSRLFDRFYRGDASRSSETGGCGIGLSMAQSIAAAHGGRITARSEDGTSLRITVTL